MRCVSFFYFADFFFLVFGRRTRSRPALSSPSTAAARLESQVSNRRIMAYSEQYYYYYKYPHYQISVGVPVGIGVCVLLVCLSVMCQKKKKQLRAQEEEEEARQAIKDESADYHAMTDVVASSDEGSGGAGEGGFGSKPRSTSPNRPILDAGGQSPSALGAVRGSSQFVRAEANPLSRFEEIGGDWVGFSFRAGSVAAVDSLYFQMRGVMAVGAHQDHVGSYTVDGIINPRERSVSFNKTYASSRATVEYDCDLWAEVRAYRLFLKWFIA